MTRSRSPLDPEQQTALVQVGEAVDQAAKCLALWQHDRTTALYYLLTVYEDAIRMPAVDARNTRNPHTVLSSEYQRLSYEFGITPLVRLAHQLCPPTNAPIPRDPFDWEIYGQAFDALKFGDCYHAVVASIESVFNAREEIRLDGPTVHFTYLDDDILDSEAVASLVMQAPRPVRPSYLALLEIASAHGRDHLIRIIKRATTITSDFTVAYTVPSDIEDFFASRAEVAASADELPLELEIGGYMVRDFRAFYRYLYKRCATHQCFCWYGTQDRVPGMGVGSIVLEVTTDELRTALVESNEVSQSAFDSIIVDSVYDDNHRHTDIFFQPLIRIGVGRYMVSPIQVTASSWERNLQRVWAIKHHDEYGAKIGVLKRRLAGMIVDRFCSLGFTATADTELSVDNGPAITDVDVAVRDDADRTVFLAEVKWPVTPAEAREVRQADELLLHGVNQVHDAVAFIAEHPDHASELLFSGVVPSISDGYYIRASVISRNYLGSGLTRASAIPVFDFHLVDYYLRERAQGKRLATIVDEITALHALPKKGVDYDTSEEVVELAGYTIHIPGYRLLIPTEPPTGSGVASPPRISRNSPCPCGSGKRYKRCHGVAQA